MSSIVYPETAITAAQTTLASQPGRFNVINKGDGLALALIYPGAGTTQALALAPLLRGGDVTVLLRAGEELRVCAFNATSVQLAHFPTVSDADAPRPRSRLGATIGDSRLAQGVGLNGASTSVWQNRFARGPQHWISILSGGRVQFPASLSRAVGGHDLSEILETLDADLAEVVAGGAGFILYLAGVNSFRANAELPAVIAQETEIVTKLKATGLPVIIFDEWPGAGPTFASTAEQWSRHVGLRDYRRQTYPADPAITYIDGFTIMSNPSSPVPYEIAGSGKEDLYQDTYLHLSPRGAKALITEQLLEVVRGWFPAPALPPASGLDDYGNTVLSILNNNPTFTGTGGTAGIGGSGVAAPGWSFTMSSGSGCTNVLSKSTIDFEGRVLEAQRSVITGTSEGTLRYARFGEQVIPVTPGQKIMIVGHVEVAPGSTGVRSVEVGITDNASNWSFVPSSFALTELIPADGFKGRLISEILTIPAGVTSITIRHRAYFSDVGQPVSLDVKIGGCYVLSLA